MSGDKMVIFFTETDHPTGRGMGAGGWWVGGGDASSAAGDRGESLELRGVRSQDN